jgi:hypothetical protein
MKTVIDGGASAIKATLEAQSTTTGRRTARTPQRSIIDPTKGMVIAEAIAAMPPAAEMLARSQPNSAFNGLMKRPSV